jgi:multidrug efflux pump subunit AcrB
VQDWYRDVSGGTLKGRAAPGRWASRAWSPTRESLATLPVLSASRPGVSARLEEVARIERARAPATQYAASDGREAISLAINKKAGANTLELVDRLRTFIARKTPSSPPAACK